jgi:Tol biopolymer transport system component
MTARYDLERQVSSWLRSELPSTPPAGLLEAIQREVEVTPRRRAWQIPDRWFWRHAAGLRVAARGLVLVLVLAALVVVVPLILGIVGAPRPAPPFGLTRAGMIAVDTAEGIVVAHADGTQRTIIVAEGQSVSPTWSRDGLHLAFWHRSADSGAWSLIVADATGQDREVLAEGITLKVREESLFQPSNLSWSPDSTRIAFAADVGSGTSIMVARLGRAGATQITDPSLEGIDPAWAPNGGVIAFQSSATGTLHVVQADGSGARRLSSLTDTFLWPDWSPDGSRLATTAGFENQSDIFVVSADGSVVTNVSHDASAEYSPTWSPDGSRLAWARVPVGGSARGYVVVADPDGPNLTEMRIEADLAPPVWSPDGSRVYSYVQAPDGTFAELVILDPEGVAPVVRLPATGNIGNGNWQRLP